MSHTPRWTLAAACAAACAAALAVAAPAHAQQADGFAFRAPTVALSLRGGLGAPAVGGDLFDFVTSTLTVERGDFVGPALAGEVTFAAPNSRLGLVLGMGFQSGSSSSDYRELEGDDGLPILQRTELRQVPLTLGARLALVRPGRSIGSFAWVPRAVVPYLGAGGGAAWYSFRQEGEFVDFETNEIFPADVRSSKVGLTAYAGGGVDVALRPGIALTVDARYQFGSAPVGGDFDGFDRIDLSGLVTTAGITFRF